MNILKKVNTGLWSALSSPSLSQSFAKSFHSVYQGSATGPARSGLYKEICKFFPVAFIPNERVS